jgi:ubiquilin
LVLNAYVFFCFFWLGLSLMFICVVFCVCLPKSPAGSAQGATRSSGNTRTGASGHVGGTGATGGLGGLGSPDLSSLLGGLAGSPRTGASGGLGGLGSPDLGNMLGGSPDVSLFSQMLQNPAMMQMMQSIMSDPQTMNQVVQLVPTYSLRSFLDVAILTLDRFVFSPWPQLLSFNPNARNLMESNPQMREIFQNPEFLRQLTSPETLQVCYDI